MNQYTCYHLNITSDLLPLPELTSTSFTTPDLTIRRGHISDEGLIDGNILGPFLQATPQQLWLHVLRSPAIRLNAATKSSTTPEPEQGTRAELCQDQQGHFYQQLRPQTAFLTLSAKKRFTTRKAPQ